MNDQTRKTITIRLPEDLKEKIQQQADIKGISFNAQIILSVRLGLEAE